MKKNQTMRQAISLTGGTKNRVVESHPFQCAHCGFHGSKHVNSCRSCGVQTHVQCLAMETCQMCETKVEGVCQLCLVADPAVSSSTSTDRLSKCITHYGREWVEWDDGNEEDFLPHVDWDVVQPLTRVPAASLPDGGRRRMQTTSPDGRRYVSLPHVVHTWCAHSLFGCVDGDWENLHACLDRPPKHVYGMAGEWPKGRATHETHACVFCGSCQGWLTFCAFHLSQKAGCSRCRASHDDVPEKKRASHAFHPSCAVWAGMQRVLRPVRVPGRQGVHNLVGMVCFRNKDWRSLQLEHLKMWLDSLSGFNSFLDGYRETRGEDVDAHGPFKGERYSRKRKERVKILDVREEEGDVRALVRREEGKEAWEAWEQVEGTEEAARFLRRVGREEEWLLSFVRDLPDDEEERARYVRRHATQIVVSE